MSEQQFTESSSSTLPAPVDFVDPELSIESSVDVTRYVVVDVNHNHYGMTTDTTVELMSAAMTQITRVPHSPPYISGVINHRGTIIPVIDLRSLLGFEPRSLEMEKMRTMFDQLKEDHISWLGSLQNAVYVDEKFTKAIDPTKCNFGKWYISVMDGTSSMSSMISADPILKGVIERFDAPHRKIHSIAEKVLSLKENGQSDEAISIIKNVRENELVEMCDLFDQVLAAIETKLKSMLVITEIGTRKAAIAVDEVSFVIDCNDDSVEPLPETAENTEFLSGLVYQDDGSYILIADLSHIYNTACPQE
ncbi:MAG: chemotaxis protein CheW [Phycisphaerales bacterium]|nr:chemotaxis protein CheW [Phycisphaerales bacterium]